MECDFDYCFYLDPEIVDKVFAATRRLDSIHQAAMIALYTLDAQGLLDDHARYLPTFLLCPEEACAPILSALEECGLLRFEAGRLVLVHRPESYPRAKGTVECWAETCGQSVEEFKKGVDGRQADYSYSKPVPKICPDTGLGG